MNRLTGNWKREHARPSNQLVHSLQGLLYCFLVYASCSPGLEDDLTSVFWNALTLEPSPDTYHTAWWIWCRRGWCLPFCGSVIRFHHRGSRTRRSISKRSSIGYHIWHICTGATSNTQAWSCWTLDSTLGIKLKHHSVEFPNNSKGVRSARLGIGMPWNKFLNPPKYSWI